MDANAQSEAEAVVAKQLDAYNARDINAFVAMWADDAEYFAHPNELLARGIADIRDRHSARFQEPGLYGKLIARVSVGNLVVDREIVTRNFPEGRGKIDVIAIYEVEAGKIARAWFKLGSPIFDKDG